MFNFKKPEPEVQVVYKVIEVKSPRSTQAWTKEIKDAVATLQSHPGFVAITDRLALQRQMLENKCSHERQQDLQLMAYLQAGVFWLSYIQDLVAGVTKVPRGIPQDAFDEELEAFKQLDAQIERIGME